jgi:hypothetical protein
MVSWIFLETLGNTKKRIFTLGDKKTNDLQSPESEMIAAEDRIAQILRKLLELNALFEYKAILGKVLISDY